MAIVNVLSQVVAWAASHGMLSAGMIAGAAGFALRHYLEPWFPKAEAKVEGLLNLEISKLSPEEKALLLEADKYLDSMVPAAGDSRYAAVAAMITSKVPALAPYSDELTEVLSDLGAAAKAILEAEQPNL